MAPPFIFPSNLLDLEQELDDAHLFVHNPINVNSLSPSEVEELVKGVVFDLSDKELFCVEEQDVFDRVYSLAKAFSFLTPASKCNFVESLRSNLSVLLPSIDSLSRASSSPPCADGINFSEHVGSHRNALKIYTFFLLIVILTEESSCSVTDNSSKTASQSRKKHVANLCNWETKMGRILNLIANSLEMNLSLIFGSSCLDENYLSFVSRCVFSMFENPSMLRDLQVKEAMACIIGTCATKYRYTMQSCASILHLLHKFDFVVTPMADTIAVAANKYGDGSLAVSLIREIGRTSPKDYMRDTMGADNVGRFLVEIADRVPKIISMNVGLLVPHFGGESYKIRNALVGVLGKLVVKAFNEVEGDASSKAIRLRSKQAMLDILLERCKDVSAYTRSRVLQVWAELCEQNAVSMGLWNELASVAAGRLEDKSAIVRKSALNLLIMMLQHNPFGPQLRTALFEATLNKYQQKLHALEADTASSSSVRNVVLSGSEESEAAQVMIPIEVEQLESVSDSCLCSLGGGSKDSSVADFGNLEDTRTLVASLEAGLRFSKCISSITPVLLQLLASSSVSDVENTIHLLMRCQQFHIDGSHACLRKMLPLAFSPDKSISEAVENAFITIYIKQHPAETARSLLNLAAESNIGDLEALELLIGSLVLKGDISMNTISALWDFFSFNVSGVTAEQSRGALSILCMAAKASPRILGSHLQDIVDIGFGRWAKEEPLLARMACIALERLCETDKEKLLLNNGSKVFSALQSLITSFSLPENIWYAAADKSISCLYHLHPSPEILSSEIVKKSLFSLCDANEDTTSNGFNSISLSAVNVTRLSRFLFVVSHVALNQMVYVESCVRKIHKQKIKKERSLVSDLDAKQTEKTAEENGINAEIGFSTFDDALLDSLSERAQKEIVSGGSVGKQLIGHCAPFISKLCRNITLMQKFPELHASAMLALCRLMIIDSNFCEENIQLLFTVLECASSETVRSNCTIALGDLAIRFPNLLEPWTENVYACLHDHSASVRKNAVLVLSHLILNDMMKVKGHISEMAMRLDDEDVRISSLARLFFHELSKKGSNPIYNLLPDILGRLSNQNLQEDTFYNIMQFLIGSIKKDKQMEALVEKLCNRFGGVTDHKQWEHIAYCLSQLTFTEKGIKKLMDSFKSYEHALSDDSVVEYFRNIINKGKKTSRSEFKVSIEEFEQKLCKHHLGLKEQEEISRNALAYQERVFNSEDIVKDANVTEDFLEDGAPVVTDLAVKETMHKVQTDANDTDKKPIPFQIQIDGSDLAMEMLTCKIQNDESDPPVDPAISQLQINGSLVSEESTCESRAVPTTKDMEVQSSNKGIHKPKTKGRQLNHVGAAGGRLTRLSRSRSAAVRSDK